MSVTLSISPTYPIPGRPCLVTFTATSGNMVRVYATAGPTGSSIQAQLDATDDTRIRLWSGEIEDTWIFRPDVGGVYVLSAEEYTVGETTHGGGYKDDPDSYPSETLLSTTATSITVANKVTADIGVPPDTATLELYVHGTTIRPTLVGVHGEATPTLTNPTTDKAKTAVASATVVAALAALSGVAASTALGTPSSIIDDLIVKYEAHRASGTFHADADVLNWVAASFRVPGSPAGVAKSANELRTKLTRHMTNDEDGAGFGTIDIHAPGAAARADQAHALIVAGANEQEPLSQCLMIADIWRAYEAHRIDTTYHDAADTTNGAAVLPELLQVYFRFLEALAAASPTVPATTNSGVVFLAHSGGLTVS